MFVIRVQLEQAQLLTFLKNLDENCHFLGYVTDKGRGIATFRTVNVKDFVEYCCDRGLAIESIVQTAVPVTKVVRDTEGRQLANYDLEQHLNRLWGAEAEKYWQVWERQSGVFHAFVMNLHKYCTLYNKRLLNTTDPYTLCGLIDFWDANLSDVERFMRLAQKLKIIDIGRESIYINL